MSLWMHPPDQCKVRGRTQFLTLRPSTQPGGAADQDEAKSLRHTPRKCRYRFQLAGSGQLDVTAIQCSAISVHHWLVKVLAWSFSILCVLCRDLSRHNFTDLSHHNPTDLTSQPHRSLMSQSHRYLTSQAKRPRYRCHTYVKPAKWPKAVGKHSRNKAEQKTPMPCIICKVSRYVCIMHASYRS